MLHKLSLIAALAAALAFSSAVLAQQGGQSDPGKGGHRGGYVRGDGQRASGRIPRPRFCKWYWNKFHTQLITNDPGPCANNPN